MMTPAEIELLADALAERLAGRVADADGLLDVHAAARLLGCSAPTVERLVRDGKIASIKVGRLRRFRRADLLARNEKGGPDA
ncbi:MAG TPA: helix-turn-helix domain-containing protein [Pirellulaceae bacterium]|nr:helix-turn-helix domain-containing protein [Pirellulaceae bacterium]HMO92804.1 helix-turn-helix domain-containing protein [Pirellulaceae bacterium]HMP69386.1 helix-turn-helix domain-containing protein [Pirellulaceae bacterium]